MCSPSGVTGGRGGVNLSWQLIGRDTSRAPGRPSDWKEWIIRAAQTCYLPRGGQCVLCVWAHACVWVCHNAGKARCSEKLRLNSGSGILSSQINLSCILRGGIGGLSSLSCLSAQACQTAECISLQRQQQPIDFTSLWTQIHIWWQEANTLGDSQLRKWEAFHGLHFIWGGMRAGTCSKYDTFQCRILWVVLTAPKSRKKSSHLIQLLKSQIDLMPVKSRSLTTVTLLFTSSSWLH